MLLIMSGCGWHLLHRQEHMPMSRPWDVFQHGLKYEPHNTLNVELEGSDWDKSYWSYPGPA